MEKSIDFSYLKRCQSSLLHDHQSSGALESEGGREHEEILEGARHPNGN